MNWYDHHARQYDAEIGRWSAIDPALQAVSPYMAMGNNPMMNVDEDGEFWHLVIGAAIGGVFNWASNGAKFNGDGLRYFGVGAISGALAAGVGGGTTAMFSGSTFGAGFVGSQSATAAIASSYSSSFISGAAIGGASGFSGGLASGFGNALVNGQNFGQALNAGAQAGVVGGVSGALMGGITGGFDAAYGNPDRSRNFWNGDDIGRGRTPFSFKNVDRPWTDYHSNEIGYEPRYAFENILNGKSTSSYANRIRFGDAPINDLPNGSESRLLNYTTKDQINRHNISEYLGRADMQIINDSGYDFVVKLNGKVVIPRNNMISIFEGTQSITVEIMKQSSTDFFVGPKSISPFKYMITGFKSH